MEDANLPDDGARSSGARREGGDLSFQAAVQPGGGKHRPPDGSFYKLLSPGPRDTRARVLVYQHGRGEQDFHKHGRDGESGTLATRAGPINLSGTRIAE